MSNTMASILKMAAVALLALVLVAFVSACSSSSGDGGDAAPNGGGDNAEEHIDDADDDEAATSDDDAVAASHGDGGVVDAGDELVVTMRTENVKFVPDTITVKVGQTVRLRLDNHDGLLHDYTVDEAEFGVQAVDGASHEEHASVLADDAGTGSDAAPQVSMSPLHIAADGNGHADMVFEATEPGEYVFYCSVPGHREAGMEGKLIVQ